MSNVSNEFLSVLGKDSEKYHFQASQAKKLKKLGMLHQHVQKTTSLTVLAVVLIDNIYNCMLKSEFTKTYEKYDIHTYVHISRKKKFGERVGFPKSDVIKQVGQAKSDQIGLRQVGRSKIGLINIGLLTVIVVKRLPQGTSINDVRRFWPIFNLPTYLRPIWSDFV